MKVRDELAPGDFRDPGPYRNPPGTVARRISADPDFGRPVRRPGLGCGDACPTRDRTPGPQARADAVHHFRPVGVVGDLLAKELRLRGAPATRFRQRDMRRQRPVGGDEVLDAHGIVGEAQLAEQVAQGMNRTFHGHFLPCVGVEPIRSAHAQIRS